MQMTRADLPARLARAVKASTSSRKLDSARLQLGRLPLARSADRIYNLPLGQAPGQASGASSGRDICLGQAQHCLGQAQPFLWAPRLSCPIDVVVLARMQATAPEWLEFNHDYTFTVLVYGLVFALWYLWTVWGSSATAPNRPPSSKPPQP